jgi:hypothetical protein
VITRNRRSVWITLAASSALLVYFAPSLDTGLVNPTASSRTQNTTPSKATDTGGTFSNSRNTEVLKIKSRELIEDASTSFSVQQWILPVKAAAVKPQLVISQPEAPPQVPAMPCNTVNKI